MKKILLSAAAMALFANTVSAEEVLRIITWKGYTPADLRTF
jgi:spermidine/putrescine-binding protein